MDIAITKMSSKGQVVIPAEMRENILSGEKLFIIKNDKQLILKKTSDLYKSLKEDMEFAKRTEEALKRFDKGELKEMKKDDFLKELPREAEDLRSLSLPEALPLGVPPFCAWVSICCSNKTRSEKSVQGTPFLSIANAFQGSSRGMSSDVCLM